MTKRTFIYSILIAVIISTTFSAIITHAITTRNLYNKYGKDNFQHEKQMEAVETPSIGITVQNTVSTDGSQHINITEINNKRAKIEGFQQEDDIIAVDNQKVNTTKELSAILRQHKSGDVITITVTRLNETIEIKALLN